MNEELWRGKFKHLPAWPCPACGTGTLHVVDGSFREHLHPGDLGCIQEGYIDPDDVIGMFAAILECGCRPCNRHVLVHGIYESFREGDGNEFEWINGYTPKSFYPSPPLVMLPEKTPEAVAVHMERSFGLYWSDPLACAGALRSALEAIADHLGIPRNKPNGGFYPLSQRLKVLERTHPKLADVMDAIKNVGNDGAHGDAMNSSTLLAAYELLAMELRALYVDESARKEELLRQLRDGRETNENSCV